MSGETVRQRVLVRARWLSAASIYLFFIIIFTIVFSEFLRPFLLQLSVWHRADQTVGVSVWEVLNWLILRALMAAPALVLGSAIWGTHAFLQQLGAGEWRGGGTAYLLRRIGTSLLLSAALSIVIVPTLTHWLEAQGGVYLHIETAAVALGALGGLLIVVADVLGQSLRNAEVLRAENDSFI